MSSDKSICVVSKRCISRIKPIIAVNVEECDTSGADGSGVAGDKKV